MIVNGTYSDVSRSTTPVSNATVVNPNDQPHLEIEAEDEERGEGYASAATFERRPSDRGSEERVKDLFVQKPTGEHLVSL